MGPKCLLHTVINGCTAKEEREVWKKRCCVTALHLFSFSSGLVSYIILISSQHSLTKREEHEVLRFEGWDERFVLLYRASCSLSHSSSAAIFYLRLSWIAIYLCEAKLLSKHGSCLTRGLTVSWHQPRSVKLGTFVRSSHFAALGSFATRFPPGDEYRYREERWEERECV